MASNVEPRMKRHSGLNFDVRHMGFAYQLQAVEAVKGIPYAAVFHEQGLGKTKIGIDLALEWLRTDAVDTILIVTKRSLVQNWVEELAAHSHFKPRVLDQNHLSTFYALNANVPILLTHYEVMRTEERRLSLFLKTRRVAALLDESQKIKNPDADLSKALHRLAPLFAKRVIMTGTPVSNRPYDLWSQIYFLDAGKSLGTDFARFKENLDLGNDLFANEPKRTLFEEDLGKVFDQIRSFSVRETKASAGISLPEKYIKNVKVALAPRQLELYDQVRTALAATVVVSGEVVVDDSEEMLKRLLRLVQIASDPALIDESYREVPGKMPVLLDLVGRALSEDSKVIVWTSFVDSAERLAAAMRSNGSVVVHGRLDISQRNLSINQFKKDPNSRILVATPGAAKEGLTLTMANHAIFYDRSFSLDDYLQAQDRIHRISQKKACYVWNLIGHDTIDEWVDQLLMAKRLAAQLAQADISAEEYRRAASYDFGKLVKEILGGGGE